MLLLEWFVASATRVSRTSCLKLGSVKHWHLKQIFLKLIVIVILNSVVVSGINKYVCLLSVERSLHSSMCE
jgi:hypothetical protein